MAALIVAVVSWVGLRLIAWARGKRSLGFWQFNLAQILLLLTISVLLGTLLRWWYLNECLQRS
jgi:hypothetical protein